MQLLVSVRSAAEVGPALSGGADIVDAKEPRRGSLGAVSSDVLAEIAARVPRDRALSVALGDLPSPDQVFATIGSLGLNRRAGPLYLKLGFAGVDSRERIGLLISAAVAASVVSPESPRIVAVAYADAARAGSVSPDSLARVAAASGAAGILLDTHTKDRSGLLRWIEPAALGRWVTSARRAGLMTALAGELGLGDVELIRAAGADVLGVRGAACTGGRDGRISAWRVRELHRRLAEGDSGYVQGPRQPRPVAGSRNA